MSFFMKIILYACIPFLLAKKMKYLILHDRFNDPFINLDNKTFSLAAPETIFFNNIERYDITTALIDQDIIYLISNSIIIENDPQVYLPQSSEDLFFATNSNNFMLEDVPVCSEIPNNNVKIIIMDSLFVKPKFLNANVETLANFVEPYECLEHGANVASVIAKINPLHKMNFLNIAVFPCIGPSSGLIILRALNVIMDEAKSAPDKMHIVNFSGEGRASRVLDYAFIMASKLPNVRIHVAAGNNAQNCMLTSPARASAVSSIRSVGSACQMSPCDFTNYEDSAAGLNEQCVSINLPSCFYIVSPYFGSSKRLCGTSFSSPIDTALDVIATFKNPKFNTDDIFSMLNEGGRKLPVPDSSHFSGMWQVLDKTIACPIQASNRSLSGADIVAYRRKGPVSWYNATSSGTNATRFCVEFSLPTITPFAIKAKFDRNQRQSLRLNIYFNKISRNKMKINFTIIEKHRLIYKGTANKSIPVKNIRFSIEMPDDNHSLQFYLMNTNQARKAIIFSANITESYKIITFDGIKRNRKVLIDNPQRCYYRM